MAIAYVRDTGLKVSANFSGTHAGSFASAPAVGNHVFVGISLYDAAGSGISTVTDNQIGNSYVEDVESVENTSAYANATVYSVKVAGSTGTYTITVDPVVASGLYIAWSAVEFSGVHATAWKDQTGTNKIVSTTVDGSVTASGANTTASGLALAVLSLTAGDAAANITTPSGFLNIQVNQDASTYQGFDFSYRIYSSSETSAATWTHDNTSQPGWATAIVTYKDSGVVADTIVTPQFIAAGAQTVTNTAGATLAPALPAGWAVGDLLVMIIAGRCNGSTITNTFSNTWNLKGSQFLEVGTGNTDLWIGVYTRIAQPGEAAPTVTPDSDFLPGSTTGGVSAQIGGFRYASETLDVAAATNTSAAAATWTPPSVTTVNPYALVVSCVATADDNALNFNTANSFALAMSGANYDTTTGSDHAVGMGYLVQNPAGAVTMPVWNESAVGNDAWVGVTVAFTLSSTGVYRAINQAPKRAQL